MTSRRSRDRHTVGSRLGRVEEQASKQAKLLGEVRREIIDPRNESRVTENDLGLINKISAEDSLTIDAPGPLLVKKGQVTYSTRTYYTFPDWSEAFDLPASYLRAGDEVFIEDVNSSGCWGLYQWINGNWQWKEGLTEGTAVQRDRYWEPPFTSADRLAMHLAHRTWYRTDKGWTEQYFASNVDGGTRTNGGTNATGWFPITGRLPKAKWYRADGAQNMGQPGWNTTIGFFKNEEYGSPEIERNAANHDQLFIRVAGFYKAHSHFNLYATSGGTTATTEFAHIRRDNPTAGYDYKANSFKDISGSDAHIINSLVRYDVNNVFQVSMYVRSAGITSRCYQDHYFSTIEYVSPPYLALATTTGD